MDGRVRVSQGPKTPEENRGSGVLGQWSTQDVVEEYTDCERAEWTPFDLRKTCFAHAQPNSNGSRQWRRMNELQKCTQTARLENNPIPSATTIRKRIGKNLFSGKCGKRKAFVPQKYVPEEFLDPHSVLDVQPSESEELSQAGTHLLYGSMGCEHITLMCPLGELCSVVGFCGQERQTVVITPDSTQTEEMISAKTAQRQTCDATMHKLPGKLQIHRRSSIRDNSDACQGLTASLMAKLPASYRQQFVPHIINQIKPNRAGMPFDEIHRSWRAQYTTQGKEKIGACKQMQRFDPPSAARVREWRRTCDRRHDLTEVTKQQNDKVSIGKLMHEIGCKCRTCCSSGFARTTVLGKDGEDEVVPSGCT